LLQFVDVLLNASPLGVNFLCYVFEPVIYRVIEAMLVMEFSREFEFDQIHLLFHVLRLLVDSEILLIRLILQSL